MWRGILEFLLYHNTSTPNIYTLSLHDALPILQGRSSWTREYACTTSTAAASSATPAAPPPPPASAEVVRSEEHTSELQSHSDLVCRLLLEKKIALTSVFSFGSAGADFLRLSMI